MEQQNELVKHMSTLKDPHTTIQPDKITGISRKFGRKLPSGSSFRLPNQVREAESLLPSPRRGEWQIGSVVVLEAVESAEKEQTTCSKYKNNLQNIKEQVRSDLEIWLRMCLVTCQKYKRSWSVWLHIKNYLQRCWNAYKHFNKAIGISLSITSVSKTISLKNITPK